MGGQTLSTSCQFEFPLKQVMHTSNVKMVGKLLFSIDALNEDSAQSRSQPRFETSKVTRLIFV